MDVSSCRRLFLARYGVAAFYFYLTVTASLSCLSFYVTSKNYVVISSPIGESILNSEPLLAEGGIDAADRENRTIHSSRDADVTASVGTTPTLFVAVNVMRSEPPVWLDLCRAPSCHFRVFRDGGGPRREKGSVAYPSWIGKGRMNFGFRGKFQMRWSLDRGPGYDYFLRVDEDGYLCLEQLLRELRRAPRSKFIWGRFHCDPARTRMDENFMLMTRDAARHFVEGWTNGTILFRGKTTLALNIGSQLACLHSELGWSFRADPRRIRWDEQLRPEDDCGTHVWFHHLNRSEIDTMHGRDRSSFPDPSLAFDNNTGCGLADGLPRVAKKSKGCEIGSKRR